MKSTTLSQICDWIDEADFQGESSAGRRKVSGVSTDSRSIRKGELFVALRGEQFDGHRYVKQAQEAGAKAAMVTRRWYRGASRKGLDLPLILVEDTLRAYGTLACKYRRQFDIPVVAIAGSNGKTSTKELTAAVLRRKYEVLVTEKNYNNEIGVPATLLRLEEEHEAAVIELGTNHPGEIRRLAQIAEPTHGVITNIGREHLEFLRSIEGVAREEGALFEWLAGNGGTLFVNLDDSEIVKLARNVEDTYTYGRTNRADYQAKIGRTLSDAGAPEVEFVIHRKKSAKPFTIQLQTPGKHTAHNALAALAIADVLKVPIKEIKAALQEHEPPRSEEGYARLDVVELSDGGRVLNDTYNANPDSTLAALDTLECMRVGRKGKRIAVLGDMGELGGSSEAEHASIGEYIAEKGKVHVAMFIGRQMRHAYEAIARSDQPEGVMSFFFRSRSKLKRLLDELRQPEDVVLVKGSRSMEMEEFVAHLKDGEVK